MAETMCLDLTAIEIYTPATEKQLSCIHRIEQELSIHFRGKSLQEASSFISKYLEKAKEASEETDVDDLFRQTLLEDIGQELYEDYF